jgi:hypothetical protein
MDSEVYLLAKTFFHLKALSKSEVHLKFEVIWHFRHIIHVRDSQISRASKQSLLQQVRKAEREGAS